ncbi:WD repeat-containing protein 90 [Entophlyctis luteolus]|nr:WD repeat-containing protein 90 [Entophlyctis luteolus]
MSSSASSGTSMLRGSEDAVGPPRQPSARPHGKSVGAKIHDLVHASNAACLRIGSKSGKLLVSGSTEGILNIWALGRTTPLLHLQNNSSAITSLAIDWQEDYVIVGCATGPIKLWDLRHEKVARSLLGHRLTTTAVEYHPFGEFFVSGGKESVVKVWDVKKKGCIQTYSNPGGSGGSVEVIRITPDGRWIASGWEDGSVKVSSTRANKLGGLFRAQIWDMTAGKLLKNFSDSNSPVTSITFSPFEFLMTVGYADGRVWFYDLESFTTSATTPPLGSIPRSIEFHTHGQEVFVACENSIQVILHLPSKNLSPDKQ